MQNILVIFGGRSAEHEISIRSARNVIEALDKTIYNPIPVVISRSGAWYLLHSYIIPETMIAVDDNREQADLCMLLRRPNETIISTQNGKSINIDAAFPLVHGPMGEDGTLQGMFEMMMLPYVGSGVLSSAIGMDKDFLKLAFSNKKVPVVPSVTIAQGEKIPRFQEICLSLGSDILFVKPAVMGSSVGVSKAKSETEYDQAITQAFKYSFKVLIEKFVPCREIECSVLGNNNPVASCIGEIKSNHEFYSYDAKYLDPNGADIIIPAQNIAQDLTDKIRHLAVEAFVAAECKGMARVDFFISDSNQIFVNELNTLPGFTSISMYPKMWEASGISYKDLMTKLLNLAVEEFKEKQKLCLHP